MNYTFYEDKSSSVQYFPANPFKLSLDIPMGAFYFTVLNREEIPGLSIYL